jgi:hypothetical protein
VLLFTDLFLHYCSNTVKEKQEIRYVFVDINLTKKYTNVTYFYTFKYFLGLAGDVILTPVRRSLRNTPIRRSGGTRSPRTRPKVISTPRNTGTKSPGLRLTPEVLRTPSSAIDNGKVTDEPMENGQESSDREEKKIDSQEDHSSDVDSQNSGEHSTIENGCAMEETCEDTEDTLDNADFLAAKRRSCLRSSTKIKLKSSHVFFQTPQPRAQSTAGDTPGHLVFTPGVEGDSRSTGAVFAPVAVSFDSPTVEGSTCSLNAGHTPALIAPRQGSLRKRASKGTPVRRSGRKHPLATPDEREMSSSDSAPDQSTSPVDKHAGTSLGCLDNELIGRSSSERRSLRRTCRKSAGNEKASLFCLLNFSIRFCCTIKLSVVVVLLVMCGLKKIFT